MIHLTSEVIDSSAILLPTYSCIPVQPRTAAYNRVHLYEILLSQASIDTVFCYCYTGRQPRSQQPASQRRRCAAANSNCARCRGASQVSHTPTPASSSLLAPRLTATGAGGRWEAMPPVASGPGYTLTQAQGLPLAQNNCSVPTGGAWLT